MLPWCTGPLPNGVTLPCFLLCAEWVVESVSSAEAKPPVSADDPPTLAPGSKGGAGGGAVMVGKGRAGGVSPATAVGGGVRASCAVGADASGAPSWGGFLSAV